MKAQHTIRTLTALALLSAANVAMGKAPAFSGGDGSSPEKAIIVKAADELSGVDAEHEYLRQRFPGAKEGRQTLRKANGRAYDAIEITTADGEKKVIYFDITAYFGK